MLLRKNFEKSLARKTENTFRTLVQQLVVAFGELATSTNEMYKLKFDYNCCVKTQRIHKKVKKVNEPTLITSLKKRLKIFIRFLFLFG